MGKMKGEWGRSQLEALGEMMDFSLDTRFDKLKAAARNAVLFGQDEEITVKMDFEKFTGEYRTRYEGLIPWLPTTLC